MDDLELLDQEIDALREELDYLEQRRRSLQQAIAALQPGARRSSPLVALLVVVGAVGILGAIIASVLSGGSGEMLYGTVAEVRGSAPVAVGAPCTVVYQDANSDNYDGRIDVLCGRRLVYGGSGLGWIDCDYAGSRPARCSDGDFTPDGGDPKLVFDRASASVVIEDVGPEWALRVELGP
jgi:hypothetical protein